MALQAEPGYAEANYNLGIVLRELGQLDRAIACYRRTLELKPRHTGTLNNLGLALTEARQPEEAIIWLRQAQRLDPKMKEAPNNLGLALAEIGRFAEAEAVYHEALRLDPDYVEANSNLGNTYKEQGRFAEAMACYQIALSLDPGSVSTRYNRSLALLQSGDWPRGWTEYEWRWRRPSTPARPFRQPRWQGESLEGKTILLYCEQGLGDTIQFVRFATLVKERGGRVILECPAGMIPLLSTCPGVDACVAEGTELPAFDVQSPLMSLPAVLGTTLETIPNQVPYLSVKPDLIERWRQRLADVPGFKVGIVWQGNPKHPWDRHRSFRLEQFEPLAAIEGVSLVSLQRGFGKEQLNTRRRGFAVVDLGEEVEQEDGMFLNAAAIMENLDLLITTDSAPAHLAGALGKPVWVCLAAISDWRWLKGGDETSWYPTMKVFRQHNLGDWRSVFSAVQDALLRVCQ